MADCRLCRHFVRYRDISLAQLERCESLALARGHECLGWCLARDRPVTYYVGPCRAYRPRSLEPPKATLATFWPELKEV